MSWEVIRGNALDLPIDDGSVDLVITSPPYFALRSYRDEGEHYDGQVGSEATPQEFLEALWAATREMMRVLKPTGSIWVNLGDKYSGAGPQNAKGRLSSNGNSHHWREVDPKRTGIPAKSLMGLPWRYAIGCIDQLGLILRAEIIWSKPNGLPESVTDRVRRSHEQWFHFTKSPRYFSAVDEVREAHAEIRSGKESDNAHTRAGSGLGVEHGLTWVPSERFQNPLGKLPGSVWTIPSEPLIIPDAVAEHYNLPDHFAAFPTEWPRRIILGWSPSGVCVACGEGRRPVVEKERNVDYSFIDQHRGPGAIENNPQSSEKAGAFGRWMSSEATITGYACACTPYTDHPPSGKSPIPSGTDVEGRHRQPSWSEFATGERGGRVGPWREYHLAGWTPPPTTPARVLDVFGGTGTVAGVAHALGRHGISVDLSADYCRLAEWRIGQSGHFTKAERRAWGERQLGLL